MSKFSMDDYIDVAERIAAFTDKYPDGSLQTLDWSVKEIAGQSFVVYRAAAFRTPEDRRPGHGTAWEPFPGATPYTKNSELMNAETAAWGRAIVAVGLSANRKIASKQEVRARKEEQDAGATPAAAKFATKADQVELGKVARGLTVAQIKMALTTVGIPHPTNPNALIFSTVPREKLPLVAQALAETERPA